MTENMTVFDRRLVRRHRERTADTFEAHGFLFAEVAERLVERLGDVRRRFPRVLDLGCRNGALGRLLAGSDGLETLIQSDLAPRMAALAARNGNPCLAADEEALPFAPASFDLVLSVFSLHWVNDLPGALIQICRALKPDGLFLGAMLGGESLKELREAFTQAELDRDGGASPRISPFADVRDAGALLQRAGFALPVTDTDRITVSYPDVLKLMLDLRGMGETNAVLQRRRTLLRRTTLLQAAALYVEAHGDLEGRIPATFDIIYLTGWAPAAGQPQALKPGSARGRLSDALGSEEHAAGEKARPR